MAIWKCEWCGASFRRNHSGGREIRFCSQRCYHQWNRKSGGSGGRFQKGITPWNKGAKGVMKVNSGSFKKGQTGDRLLPLGETTSRIDKGGHPRAWTKVASNRNPGDWIPRSTLTWEEIHGPLVHGMVIHHKDKDTLNDSIDNLEALTRAEHMLAHRPEQREGKRRATRKRNPRTPAAVL